MAVLVTGGAGYIGSHTVAALLEKNEDVVIVDSLQQGYRQAVRGGKLYIGNISDADFLKQVFTENSIDSVIHFAANSLVGESMQDPGKYYHNNVYGTLRLLETMKAFDVKRIVFSSTAATYGEPERVPIREEDRTLPTNAYGETKLAMEKMMKWFDTAHGIQYIALRYFNAAGALENSEIGEDHNPETHLIPLILQVALGQRPHISIFGDDYATADGTCIRDYIHVMDLAEAHLMSLEHLRRGGSSTVYNLGSGNGFSVKEVVDSVKKVTGKDIPVQMEGRRAGDPAVLVASAQKIKQELGWIPRRDQLETIIQDAWNWHKQHPNGYEA
jgi:UDP-glucose 4-epimerase